MTITKQCPSCQEVKEMEILEVGGRDRDNYKATLKCPCGHQFVDLVPVEKIGYRDEIAETIW